MDVCSIIPVELLIATTDSNLFNDGNWLWKGDLYWAVECLNSKQYSVAEEIVPNISEKSWLVLKTNPMQWNFCNSQFCDKNTESILLTFTFKPNSSNPMDYLQYVIDLNCHVTDYPQHTILDNNNVPFYFDIVRVNKMINKSYLELWISKAEHGFKTTETPLNLMPPSMSALHNYFLQNITNGNHNLLYIFLFVGLLIFITIIVILSVMYYKKGRTNMGINLY